MYRRRSERGNPITRLCSPAFGIRLLVRLFMWWIMQNAFRCNGQREYRVAVDHESRDDDHHNVRYASWPPRRKVRKGVVNGQPAVKSSLGRDFVKHPPPGAMCPAGHGRSLPSIMNKEAPGSRVLRVFITFFRHFRKYLCRRVHHRRMDKLRVGQEARRWSSVLHDFPKVEARRRGSRCGLEVFIPIMII